MAEVQQVRVDVNGTNIEVTPALRSHAEKYASKLVKHFDTDRHTVTVEVVLTVERDHHKAEVTLKVARLIARAEAKASEMYAAIDEAFDRVERQIRKYKTRLRRRALDTPKLGEAQELFRPVEQEEAEEIPAADNGLPKVVRTKRFALKPMSVEEAALQMELLGHDFFVFANAETEEVNVLYRRKDGQLGLIEPELG